MVNFTSSDRVIEVDSTSLQDMFLMFYNEIIATGLRVESVCNPEPYKNLEAMTKDIDTNNRLKISNMYHPFYFSPLDNVISRAWHDIGHYNHQAPFTLEGEILVAYKDVHCNNNLGNWEKMVLFSEIVIQSLEYARTGGFMEEQKIFKTTEKERVDFFKTRGLSI